ncbi:MAG: flagellar protein FlaG [Nitrospira sp. CG24C]|jgi:flagellar protein FlaG|nr:MAG: flagellar protein FlaG [Nitrospira sp. CG24C]
MVQNIRPPQGLDFLPRQSESNGSPVHGGAGRLGADLNVPVPAPTPTKSDVEQAAVRVKEVLRGTTSRLEIEIDHDLHKAVIKIFSGESGEIIRQIPSQELIDLAKQSEDMKGLLVRERA